MPGGRASKLGQLIENALSEEYAANSTPLSGLWPAMQFWPNTKTRLRSLLPISDERYHIRGGNDQIPRLLGEKLGDAVQTGTALAAVTSKDGKVQLSLTRDSRFSTRSMIGSSSRCHSPPCVSSTLQAAGFRPLKRHAIETLGMGASTKFQLRFKNRDAFGKDRLRRRNPPEVRSVSDDMGRYRRSSRGP